MKIRTFPIGTLALVTLALTGCATNDGPDAVSIFELSAGDCFTPDEENTSAYVTACEEEHMYEVSGVHPIEGDTYPGDETVQALVDEHCPASFTVFTGEVPAASADHASMAFTPSPEGWDEQGDRSVVCVVTPLYADTKEGSAGTVPSENPTPEGTS